MAKTKLTVSEVPEEEEEYGDYIPYQQNIESLVIHVYEGGKVIMQSGKPQPWPPPKG